MKKFLHSDYWAEIPAGEYRTGVSTQQFDACSMRIREQVGYGNFPTEERQQFEDFIAIKHKQMLDSNWRPVAGLFYGLTAAEKEMYGKLLKTDADDRNPYTKILRVVLNLFPRPKTIWLERFYISRYPLTEYQYELFKNGTPVTELPGALEEKSNYEVESSYPNTLNKKIPGRVATVAFHVNHTYEEFCKQIGARLPTTKEWEKAARGSDFFIYPWGNNWNPNAGYFFSSQTKGFLAVDAYPEGVSPYGVWSMTGGLEELVELVSETSRQVVKKACHPLETSPEMAWFDHITVLGGRGIHAASLRPVLDKWPVQQWQGFTPHEPLS